MYYTHTYAYISTTEGSQWKIQYLQLTVLREDKSCWETDTIPFQHKCSLLIVLVQRRSHEGILMYSKHPVEHDNLVTSFNKIEHRGHRKLSKVSLLLRGPGGRFCMHMLEVY